MLRTLSLACALASIFSVATQARTRPIESSPVFDRHAIGGMNIGPAAIERRSARKSKRAGTKHRHQARQHSRSARSSDHLLVASTGAKTSVSTVARPNFVCLLNKLEAVGYRIDFMGGYASRGNSSAHPTGNALDINQTGRNVVTRRLPANVNEIARECKLVHGGTWPNNPDQGHFEMPKKYGYVFHRHRTRYASAR